MRSPLLVLLLAAIGCGTREDGIACLPIADDEACPAPEDVELSDLAHTSECDLEAVEMLSVDTPEPETPFQVPTQAGCCYDVVLYDADPNMTCMVGRPFLDAGAPVLPAVPPVDDARAAAWLRLASMELASVAAFAHLQLELLAHGAPLDLVDRVAAALTDEVDHARRAQAHAEALAGRPLPFGAMPLPATIPTNRSLVALATDAVREGCLGETLSAEIVRAAADRAEDPAWAADLARIAEDEARHAALSWAIVAWAVRVGGAEVRTAVAAAFAAPVPVGPMVPFDGAEGAGLLGPTAAERVARATIEAVITPAARALLAA